MFRKKHAKGNPTPSGSALRVVVLALVLAGLAAGALLLPSGTDLLGALERVRGLGPWAPAAFVVAYVLAPGPERS